MKNIHLKIISCYENNYVLYTKHALEEMRNDKYGRIFDSDVFDCIINSSIIEEYPDDKPYPSILLYGRTSKQRPIHIVCAYNENENSAIVITVYHPDPHLWIDYKRRVNK